MGRTTTPTRRETEPLSVTGAFTRGLLGAVLGGLLGGVLGYAAVLLSWSTVESTSRDGEKFATLDSYFLLMLLGVLGGVLAGAAVGTGRPRAGYGVLGAVSLLALVNAFQTERSGAGRVWPFVLLLAVVMLAGTAGAARLAGRGGPP